MHPPPLLLLLLVSQLHASAAAGVPCADSSAWEVSFVDEFDGDSLNASAWTIFDNRTHGDADAEKQLYVRSAVTVRDGALRIATRRAPAPGLRAPSGVLYNYSSGWVESRGKVFHTFGRVEVRAQLPSPAAGALSGEWSEAWPAHWLMPEPSTSRPPNVCWPVGGEIDIMEGYRPRATKAGNSSSVDGDGGGGGGGGGGGSGYSVLQTYHWATACGADKDNGTHGTWPLPNDTRSDVDFQAWHTYAVEWTSTALAWFIDDAEVYRRTAGEGEELFIPSDPFYVILNTALTPWTKSGDPGFPVEHVIDSVVWCHPKPKAV